MVIIRCLSCFSGSYHLAQLFCLFFGRFEKSMYSNFNILDFTSMRRTYSLFYTSPYLFMSTHDCFVLGVDHLGSTLIEDTFVGEIVLLDRVCRGGKLETADQNLVDDSYYHSIFDMSFTDLE